jgi:hypothetical protein
MTVLRSYSLTSCQCPQHLQTRLSGGHMAGIPASSTCQYIMMVLSPLRPSQFARQLGDMPPFNADLQFKFTKKPAQLPRTPSQPQRTGATTKTITRPGTGVTSVIPASTPRKALIVTSRTSIHRGIPVLCVLIFNGPRGAGTHSRSIFGLVTKMISGLCTRYLQPYGSQTHHVMHKVSFAFCGTYFHVRCMALYQLKNLHSLQAHIPSR